MLIPLLGSMDVDERRGLLEVLDRVLLGVICLVILGGNMISCLCG